tara:strand:- start:1229 stop:2350 length:1122 start_codon:yes stop_codon:yes gene_type:complete
MSKKIKNQKIIFFLPVFSPGGASDSIIKLSKFLNDQNYSISLISIGKNRYKRYLQKIGCEVYEIKKSRALFSILELRKLIKKDLKKKYFKTILISNIHYANIISAISCYNLKGIKTIFTERSSLSELFIYNNFFNFIKNKLIFILAKYFYKFANIVITNSKFEKNYIKNNLNIKNVVHINPPTITKVEKKFKTFKKNDDLKKIIYVGRLSKEKGVITILKALLKIKDKYNFIFEIFGEGVEKKTIKKFIKTNKLSKKVLFKGFYKNNSKIFKNKDLFINASWFEGLPNALVQSLNYNVFPICSKSPGGNFEVIKYGQLGLVFKTNNSEDLKKKILLYFKKNLKLSQKTRINHLKNFTQFKSNQKYLKILSSIK